jgi:hypothetical protein
MMDSTDRAIARRFNALIATQDDSDWAEVQQRAEHGRRVRRARMVGYALTGILAIAIAAPAFGISRVVVDWFQAPPATERVQLNFAQLPLARPSDVDSQVVPDSARQVTELTHNGTSYVLSVAPTQNNGFCYEWTDLLGGCQSRSAPPTTHPELDRYLLGASWSPDEHGVIQFISGSVVAGGTDHLIAGFADGDRVEIPIVWVSKPIDAGFYLYWPSVVHRHLGHQMTVLTAVDSAGQVLARQTLAVEG